MGGAMADADRPEALRSVPFDWSLFVRTALVLGGGIVFLAGLTEIGVQITEPEQGASLIRGALFIVVGLIAAGWPIFHGVREMVRVRARGRTTETDEE